MLSFEQKINVMESFPGLERKDVSLGRVNFHYENSVYDKKTVVYHLHPNGNGFVYAGLLHGYKTDDKGFVNIRDFTEVELRAIVSRSIDSLSKTSSEPTDSESVREELWHGRDNQTLTVKYEDDLWYLFAGLNLEAAFETYEEVEQYLQEEGFSRKSSV